MACRPATTAAGPRRSVLGALLSGAVLLALAARIESRSAQPLIEPDLFRRAGYLPVLGVAIAGNFGFSALIFFTALYLQDQLDLAPLPAGLVMIAFSACFVVTLPLAGGLLQRAGPRLLMLIGMALMTAACLLLLPGGLHWMVLGLAVAGIGQGFAFNTSTTAAMDAVPAAKSGEASGVLNAARQLGSTLGIAVAGAVFQTIESRGLLGGPARPRRAGHRARGVGARAVLGLGGRPGHPGEPGTCTPGRDRCRGDGRVRRGVPRRDAALRGRLAGRRAGGAQRVAIWDRSRALGLRQMAASSSGQASGSAALARTARPPQNSGS